MPKASIISSSQRIEEILQKGERKEAKLLALFQKKARGGKRPQFAFLTEREIKRAVDRNRLKRIARELARQNQTGFKNLESIFYMKRKAIGQTFWQIKEDFDSLLPKG
ncbi:MAG: ribonuclease P protein component [candidate division Zixibacteria bacterium]|nr:ribonuclease P protein component [candidate division Zixibacteria bacterium]